MTATIRYTVEDPDQLDAVEEAFWSVGAMSVTLLDAGDEPLLEPGPGETPVWANSRLEALVPADVRVDDVARALTAHGITVASDDLEIYELPDRDWERAWMDRYQPMRFGDSIWICPSHIDPDPSWPLVIRLDPGLAFGSGTHPTTALCLEWLDRQDLSNRDVIDYGCGSGVLAIVAALKGARTVLAVDHDPQALEATRSNAETNGVADRIDVAMPRPVVDCGADIVVANILAAPLIELARPLASALRPGGRLALSGILRQQRDRVGEAYAQHLEAVDQQQREDWMLLAFRQARSASS